MFISCFKNFSVWNPILSLGQTRWLSLEACVDRILEQFLALQHHYVLVANEDPTHANDRISKIIA